MKQWLSIFPALVLAGAVLMIPVPSAGQGKAGAYKAPRAHDGKADLQGIWQASDTATAFNIEPHTPSLGMQGGLGVIVDPSDGKIPYKPAARAKQQENFKNRAALDSMNKCYMPGPARVMYIPYPIQILQSNDIVVLLSEYMHTTRNIFLKGPPLDGLELWMGDSRGKWEGDTLVVTVTQNHPETWFDQSGNHYSEKMTMVERFTRTGPDTLTYEATITDPETYTRPWTMRLLLNRRQEPNLRLLEYECNAYMEFEGGAK